MTPKPKPTPGWPLLFAAFGLLAGCGGTIAAATPQPDASAESSNDACAASGFTCPATAPATGSPCDPSGATCEYGSSPYFTCNALARCVDDGDAGLAWSVLEADPDGGPCARQKFACSDTDAVVHGGVCPIPATDTYLECDVPGENCSCTTTTPWSCQAVAPGCPDERPHVGLPCCPPSMIGCPYAPDIALACTGGNWLPQVNP